MFNAEKLLGGLLLGGARRKRGLNTLIPGGAGMALLGVAIEVDTEAERTYLKALAGRLGLNAATVDGIHRDFGVEPPSHC